MAELYRPSHRALQQRADSVRLADRIEAQLVRAEFNADDRAFIERADMFFLATADTDGRPNCSYKGGDPGFVRVLDSQTLMFPNYDGNGMFLSMGNLAENPQVGLLFIDFENRRRLRVNGSARLEPASSARPRYRGAEFVVRVVVREIFPNCPRYIHSVLQTARSPDVPRAGQSTPVPGWKRAAWAVDVLPASDPAARRRGRSPA
jgi:predicted pyridoxine 5'-phosphate oxidase superfamily flavin-nucleotide-binding protein